MVSTYYLVKLFKEATYERIKRNLNGDGKGEASSSARARYSRSELYYNSKKCRVCLKEGTIPIYSGDETSDLADAVCTFSDIEMSEDDKYPKHLCDNCHSLLKGAILFRETAKKTNQILRNIQSKLEPQPKTSHNVNDDQGNKQEKFKQTIFQKYFSSVDQINTSIETKVAKSKKQIGKVQCRVCYKIITKAYYKEHFALHDPSISKFVCDVCGKTFRQRCSYRNHYFTHGTEFPFKCKICPYRGRHSGLLKTHMRTHTGDYRYMCTECPARFLTKSNLNKHSLKHKEPTFKCDTCERAFHSKLILERHFEADHLGIKNHICNLCGKAFGYRKAMMRHQLDVHKREKKLNGRTPSYLEVENRKQDGSG